MGGALQTRYITVNISTPINTTPDAPLRTTVNLGGMILASIHLLIPAGHAGLTGWRLDYSGTTIIPYNMPASWIIGDDDKLDFEVDYEVGNTLSIVTYNTDVAYPHIHYATMKVRDLTDAPARTFTPLVVTP